MDKMKTLLILIFLIIPLSETPVHANSDENLQTYEDSVMVNELDAFYNVVIMIRFSDEADYQPPYSYEQYDHFFNATDDISLKDYYLEVSYGQLEITSLVLEEEGELVFYTDLHERSYYQPHSSENPDGYANQNERASREHALIKRAVEYVNDSNLIDPSIDLDINNDGMIDSLTFLVSGSADGWNELLWAHRWELYTLTGKNAPKINGARAFDYIFSLLDYYDSPSRPMHVGVIAHEMFHLLSAPDLYHYYADRWIRTVGPWDIMEQTNRTPSHMLGYMRETYGNWIEDVDEITESGTYTLEPIMNGADHLYRIDTGYSNEYVYLEYRVNSGSYESTLPSSGLIAYRVDSKPSMKFSSFVLNLKPIRSRSIWKTTMPVTSIRRHSPSSIPIRRSVSVRPFPCFTATEAGSSCVSTTSSNCRTDRSVSMSISIRCRIAKPFRSISFPISAFIRIPI